MSPLKVVRAATLWVYYSYAGAIFFRCSTQKKVVLKIDNIPDIRIRARYTLAKHLAPASLLRIFFTGTLGL